MTKDGTYVWVTQDELDAARKDLESFEMGSVDFQQRREEIVDSLLNNSRFRARMNLGREPIEFTTGFVKALLDLALTYRHPVTPS
jgi:hypothetical protein